MANGMKKLLGNLKKTWQKFNDDNGGLMAAGVAYYGAVSFFPLLLTLISVVGLVLQFTTAGQNAETELLQTVAEHFSPALKENVATALEQVRTGAQTSGPIGLITLLFGAMAIFIQFENAFDVIWNVKPPESKGVWGAVSRVLFQRFLAFLMVMGLGVLLLVIVVVGVVMNAAAEYSSNILPGTDWLWSLGQMVLPMILNAGVFTLTYRLLPKVPVDWSEALQGGVLASIVWEIGRYILTWFLVGNQYSSAYGVIGSFIAVLLWLYYAFTVLFLGAEFIQCICESCNVNRPPASQSSDG